MAPRVPAWRREAEALIQVTLSTPIACWIEAAATWVGPGRALPNVVLSTVGDSVPAAQRILALTRIGDILAEGGTLVVVDHNRPRRRWDAFRALLGSPWVPGVSPARRWRRLAYPTACEMQGAGWHVQRLRLAAGERLQIVFATRAPG